MLRSRISALLVIAAILSLLASVVARHLVTAPPPVAVVEAPPPPTKVTVMVATRDIEFLGVIEPEWVREHAILEEDLPGNISLYPNKLEDVVGRVSMNPIHAGSLIHKDDLKDRQDGVPLAMEVRETHRAMSIRVDDVRGVAGFLARGNLVDLLLAIPGQDHQAPSASYLAQNLRVLAVDQDLTAAKGEAKVVKAVTLEVTPEMAETIARAELTGNLRLVLRHPKATGLALVPVKRPESHPAPSMNFLEGRDSGRLRNFDCDPQKPCP